MRAEWRKPRLEWIWFGSKVLRRKEIEVNLPFTDRVAHDSQFQRGVITEIPTKISATPTTTPATSNILVDLCIPARFTECTSTNATSRTSGLGDFPVLNEKRSDATSPRRPYSLSPFAIVSSIFAPRGMASACLWGSGGVAASATGKINVTAMSAIEVYRTKKC